MFINENFELFKMLQKALITKTYFHYYNFK